MKPSLDQKWLITESMPQKKQGKPFGKRRQRVRRKTLLPALGKLIPWYKLFFFFLQGTVHRCKLFAPDDT